MKNDNIIKLNYADSFSMGGKQSKIFKAINQFYSEIVNTEKLIS